MAPRRRRSVGLSRAMGTVAPADPSVRFSICLPQPKRANSFAFDEKAGALFSIWQRVYQKCHTSNGSKILICNSQKKDKDDQQRDHVASHRDSRQRVIFILKQLPKSVSRQCFHFVHLRLLGSRQLTLI